LLDYTNKPPIGGPRSLAELRKALDELSDLTKGDGTAISPPSTRSSGKLLPGGFREPMVEPSSARLANAASFNPEVRPCSPAGTGLVTNLTRQVVMFQYKSGARQNRRGTAAKAKLEAAIGAIVGSILRAWSGAGALTMKVPCRAKAYSRQPLPYRVVMDAKDALKGLGFIYQANGFQDRTNGVGRITRVWPTDALLRLAANAGIFASTIKQHFARAKELLERASPPNVPALVVLHGLPSRPGAEDAKEMPFDPDGAEVAAIRADVANQNEFAAATRIGGCRPPQWCRKFKLDWDLHGRWYVPGSDSYQGMSSDERLEITIAGEPVVEIDIKGSLISLLHGVLGLPAPTDDPYFIAKVPRDVVKAWVNATLGKGSPVVRWSKDTIEDLPAVVEHDPGALRKLVMARYPFLAEPWRAALCKGSVGEPKRILHHMLTGIEAAILTATMAGLRDQGILGLPMHDGLIVPASAELLTCDLIRAAGMRIASVALRLKVDSDKPTQGADKSTAGQAAQ
jgi:hypothetical protein